jgi:hypothetical protein
MSCLTRSAAYLFLLTALVTFLINPAFGGQGAGRVLYVPPNSTFVEKPPRGTVSINDQ